MRELQLIPTFLWENQHFLSVLALLQKSVDLRHPFLVDILKICLELLVHVGHRCLPEVAPNGFRFVTDVVFDWFLPELSTTESSKLHDMYRIFWRISRGSERNVFGSPLWGGSVSLTGFAATDLTQRLLFVRADWPRWLYWGMSKYRAVFFDCQAPWSWRWSY